MKKRPVPPPKPKEFATSPFKALKGVQAAPAEPPVVKAPPAKASVGAVADDMALFFQAMDGVARLDAKTERPSPAKRVFPARAVIRKIEADEQQLFLDAISGLKLDVRFEDTVESPLPEKPHSPSRLRQLRRGTIRIDYELDLHGLTRDEALDALALFIGGAFRRQQQAVLIITGKGNHSPEEPVLKGAVEKWLREAGRAMVAEFLQAPRQLGGEGAVVVFLKKTTEAAAMPIPDQG